MTSDGEALLRAVSETPWDDTPRLVYADWLEENDQPERAEMIRLEVAIDCRLRQRCALLPGQVARRNELGFVRLKWLRELPKFPGVEWDDSFDRGFPSRVNTTSAAAFLKHAEWLYRAAPVSWVKIRTISAKTMRELPQSQYLARLRGLDLRTCCLGDEGVRLLCASPHLSRLGVLNLSYVGMTDAGMRTIANCQGLGSLWALWVNGNPVTDAGAVALAKSPHFPNLSGVYHNDTSITAKGAKALSEMTDENEDRLPEWRLSTEELTE